MNLDITLLNNYWHLICHKNELLNDGDYLRFDTPISDIVLFNDLGNIIAFDNKCPHRGTHLFKNDFGNQLASCPYHRWAYRNSRIVIPDKHRFVDCNIENAALNKYQIEMCGDFVFLGINPIHSLLNQLENTFEILKNISYSIEKRIDFNRYNFDCYWAIALENALEPYHVPFVHPKTLGILDLEEGKNIFGTHNSIWLAPIGNLKMKKQFVSMSKFYNISHQYQGYMSIYLFPFTTLNSTFGYSYGLQHFFPSAELKNQAKFTSRILSSKVAKTEYNEFLEPFFKQYALSVREVFKEDHEICKVIPYDSWSMEPLKYASELEIKINHFRQMCINAQNKDTTI